MPIAEELKPTYWRSYLLLEKDAISLENTVSFHRDNLNTFGLKIYNLLFLSCNLFETMAKEVCGNFESNMVVWRENPIIRNISRHTYTVMPMGYEFRPFGSFAETDPGNRSPQWWRDYNSVKHNLLNLHLATLDNMLQSLCSAGILVTVGARPTGMHSMVPSNLFDGLYIPQ